jgi:hypothetical protein
MIEDASRQVMSRPAITQKKDQYAVASQAGRLPRAEADKGETTTHSRETLAAATAKLVAVRWFRGVE